MVELFSDISQFEKDIATLAVNVAFSLNNVPKTMKCIEQYRAACPPAVQDFVDFYVQLKLEEMKNEESNPDQR